MSDITSGDRRKNLKEMFEGHTKKVADAAND
jgi:hypothetical protein